MGISPWVVGQLSPIWNIPMVRDSGPMILTGVTVGQLSLLIYNASHIRIGIGAGTFTITSTNPGSVTYQLVIADVPTVAATYYVRVQINFNGVSPDMSDYIIWPVEN